jgi:hypothetical protein
VNRGKLAIALGAVVAIVGAGVYLSSRDVSPDEARRVAEAARMEGHLNPEASAAGAKTQPMPERSNKRFEPPPTVAAGSYTDPAYRKPVDPKTPKTTR